MQIVCTEWIIHNYPSILASLAHPHQQDVVNRQKIRLKWCLQRVVKWNSTAHLSAVTLLFFIFYWQLFSLSWLVHVSFLLFSEKTDVRICRQKEIFRCAGELGITEVFPQHMCLLIVVLGLNATKDVCINIRSHSRLRLLQSYILSVRKRSTGLH